MCSSKNEAIVEYAQARSNSPTAISTYETKLIDKKLLQKKLIEYQTAEATEEELSCINKMARDKNFYKNHFDCFSKSGIKHLN